VVRIAITFARVWQRDALDLDESLRNDTVRFALELERRGALLNMLALARTLRPIAVAGQVWDKDPWLLGVKNGVVDLRNGELREGRPSDGVTLQAGVGFDPAAQCPRWLQFMEEITAGDAAQVSFLQRAVGYSLTGITTEQALFLCYGTGANGKGTFTNTLQLVLGDYAWNMPFTTIELRDRAAIPNDLAALVDRRWVTASETNDGTRLNEARVKALTGCDPVTARFLHAEFFTFEPVAKFWLSTNHKPIVNDDSHGFWRRLRLIPFTREFAVNPTLAEELRREAAGILAWGVRGCAAWQKDGLAPPSRIADATREYQADSDPLAGFLEETCERIEDGQVRACDLYDHYVDWAARHGHDEAERLTATLFGRRVSRHLQKRRTSAGTCYVGIALRPE
jgi:putative DNA primase/helicase